MNRREFLSGSVAAGIVSQTPSVAQSPAKKHPNVLYIFSDQHRAASLPGETFSQVVAPNIDAFRRSNLSMDFCISNYPLCSPHRGILMTGKYPAQSGIEANGIPMRTTELTLTQSFKNAGYHVGYVGKWHLGGDKELPPPGSPRRFGIDDWHIYANTNSHYHSHTHNDAGEKVTIPGWAPVVMTDQAIGLMNQYKQHPETPWMLIMSWNPPHPPFDPPPDDQKPYTGALKQRPNIKLPAAGGAASVANEGEFRKAEQGYFGGITGVDLQFARALKALDDLGMADDTIVVYTSDHGEMMASHGRMAKQMPWEESCRVPFSIRYPGVTPKNASSDALFASISIYPTLCGLAGIPVPKHCMGQDMSDLMRGKKIITPTEAFLLNGPGDASVQGEDDEEGGGEGEGGGGKGGSKHRADEPAQAGGTKHGEKDAEKYRGLRTATHTYAVMADGRWLLYDNVADPYQLNNLAKDPAHKELMDGFDVKLRAWIKSTGDRFPFPRTPA